MPLLVLLLGAELDLDRLGCVAGGIQGRHLDPDCAAAREGGASLLAELDPDRDALTPRDRRGRAAQRLRLLLPLLGGTALLALPRAEYVHPDLACVLTGRRVDGNRHRPALRRHLALAERRAEIGRRGEVACQCIAAGEQAWGHALHLPARSARRVKNW